MLGITTYTPLPSHAVILCSFFGRANCRQTDIHLLALSAHAPVTYEFQHIRRVLYKPSSWPPSPKKLYLS